MVTHRQKRTFPVALIGATAVALAAFVGCSNRVAYTGKVKDIKSLKPVANAFVAITEDEQVPQRLTTDSEGIFFAKLSKNTQTMLLEVKADGYKDYSRRGPTVRTGSEEIFLESLLPPTPMMSTALASNNDRVSQFRTNGQPDNPVSSGARGRSIADKVMAAPETEEELVRNAQKDLRIGNYETAMKEFRRAAQLNPKDYLPHKCLALDYSNGLDFDAVVKEFSLAVKAPNAPDKLEEQATLAVFHHDALKERLQETRLHPNDLDRHFYFARELYWAIQTGTRQPAKNECLKFMGPSYESENKSDNYQWCQDVVLDSQSPYKYFEDCTGK